MTSVAIGEYVWAVLPLAALHLAVPPLGYFWGERFYVDGNKDLFTDVIYRLVPEKLLSESYVRSLLADDKEPFSIRNITSLFVHGSYSHLFNNLTACLQFGMPVYGEFGSNGLYFVFLAGGAFSSIPTFLHADQKKELARLVASKLSVGGDTGTGILGSIARVWNRRGASSVGALAAGLMPTKSCGSSGAVCALMGCQLVLLLRDISTLVYWNLRVSMYEVGDERWYAVPGTTLRRPSNNNENRPQRSWSSFSYRLTRILTSTTSRLMHVLFTTDVSILFRNTVNVVRTVHYWHDECRTIYPISSASRTEVTGGGALAKAADLLQVAHSAHVQGLLFGSCFALVFGYAYPVVIKRRRSTDSTSSFDSL